MNTEQRKENRILTTNRKGAEMIIEHTYGVRQLEDGGTEVEILAYEADLKKYLSAKFSGAEISIKGLPDDSRGHTVVRTAGGEGQKELAARINMIVGAHFNCWLSKTPYE